MKYLILILVFTGCTHFDKREWHGDGTHQQFLNDKVDCEVKAGQAIRSSSVFEDCMISKGYRLGHK